MRFFELDADLMTAAKLAMRVIEQRLGRNSPIFATYFITNRCNVRCDGCIYYENLDPNLHEKELDTEKCLKVMRGLAEGGVPIVQLAGGEPYLRKDLPEILREGHRAGIALSVVSNAMRLYDRGLEAVDECCRWALYSPHVPTELGGKRADENYEAAWKGFIRMREALKRPKLVCAVNINKHTIPLLDDIFERAIAAGADAIKFQPNFVRSLFPTCEALESAIGTLHKWKRKHPGTVMATDRYIDSFRAFFADRPAIGCTANRRFHLGIQADGMVSACCPEFVPIGNLLEKPLSQMLSDRLENRDDCYGCQRLDIAQSLRLAGARA